MIRLTMFMLRLQARLFPLCMCTRNALTLQSSATDAERVRRQRHVCTGAPGRLWRRARLLYSKEVFFSELAFFYELAQEGQLEKSAAESEPTEDTAARGGTRGIQ